MIYIYIDDKNKSVEYWYSLSDALTFHNLNNKIITKNDITNEILNKGLWIGQWKERGLIPKKYIYYIHNSIYEKENLNVYKRIDKRLGYLKNAQCIWTYIKSEIELIEKHFNKKCYYVPFGYTKYYETSYNFINNKKDIDILFYGRPRSNFNNRRKKVIDKLRKNGLKVVWLGETKKTLNFSSKRNEYISRAKIVLSIAHQDTKKMKTNDLAKLMFLLSNKIFVIAEKMGDQLENELSEHIIMCKTIKDIIKKCKKYLNEDTYDISNNAYSYIVNHLNLYKLLPINEIKKLL